MFILRIHISKKKLFINFKKRLILSHFQKYFPAENRYVGVRIHGSTRNFQDPEARDQKTVIKKKIFVSAKSLQLVSINRSEHDGCVL